MSIPNKRNLDRTDLRINDILKQIPAPVKDEVYQQYRMIANTFGTQRHGLPKPPWAWGFQEDGHRAWNQMIAHKQDGFSKNISVYLHIPFCNRRCGFCDCISISLKEGGAAAVRRFTEKIVAEIGVWASSLGPKKYPVSTVHFGGGTPTILGPHRLNDIVKALRNYPGADSQTEWALETTSRTLRGFGMKRLKEMGFSRLHIGVQTLDDKIRKKLGRQDSAKTIIKTITKAMEMDFVVSVDLIYGLPGQSIDCFYRTLEQLVAIGVHGVSLYALQSSHRNQMFIEKMGSDDTTSKTNYFFFLTGENYLKRHGFKKNHFVHFAKPLDRQKYYRHAVRQEDLFSFGPTADGRLGHYLYRHHDYHEYMAAPPPGIAGGMIESKVDQYIHLAKSDLMAGGITRSRVKEVCAEPLLALWVAHDFLTTTADGSCFELTANGSWFLSLMLNQLQEAASKQLKK